MCCFFHYVHNIVVHACQVCVHVCTNWVYVCNLKFVCMYVSVLVCVYLCDSLWIFMWEAMATSTNIITVNYKHRLTFTANFSSIRTAIFPFMTRSTTWADKCTIHILNFTIISILVCATLCDANVCTHFGICGIKLHKYDHSMQACGGIESQKYIVILLCTT